MHSVIDKLLCDMKCAWHSDKINPDDIGNTIIEAVLEIERDQDGLRDSWKRYARAYSNRDEMGLDWDLGSSRELDTNFVTENVVKSVIDTAASIIAKNRVKVRVLTNGADFTDQRRARNLEKFIYGEMKSADTWELGPLVFRDACIFGTGVLKVFDQKNRIKVERKLISNIIVDERSAIDGHPREMFERQLVDKEVLKGLFPKYAAALDEASDERTWNGKEIPEGQVVVIEGWRLGQRHVIVCNGVLLFTEKYTKQNFPFVFFRWDGLPISGFYGLGLARDLNGIQTRINQLNIFIQRCQDLIAVPRVFVDMASKSIKVQIDNKIGAIIPYRGKPPTFYTPTALNAEIYNYKEQLKRSGFEFAGISQMSAQSLKPAGLESAVALREFSDIETSRFVIQSQRYERMQTQIGEKIIAVARDLYKNKKVNLKSYFPNATVIQKIEWSEVDIDKDRFSLDIQPASLLSMSPSARLQAVTELAQVGQLDKTEVRYLLGHPDLEASSNLATADVKNAQQVEEDLLEGKNITPEPFQNLNLLSRRVQLLYLNIQSEYDNVPDEILENIRTYISNIKTLTEQAVQASMPPEQMAQPGQPDVANGADPMAAPSNEQLPPDLPGM